jgi:hypothetical protein
MKKELLSPEGQLQPIQPATMSDTSSDYDIDGLRNDFPTATLLEQFVFDQTQIVLNLKGRSNDIKYAVALQALNGDTIESRYLGRENPYLDRKDLIPEEPLKPIPSRDPRLPAPDTMATSFYSGMVPHPDKSMAAEDRKVDVQFRKYRNGVISYEILGPLEPRNIGMKLDKYGRERPEMIRYIDPRTGEQLMKDRDGSYSEIGNRLRGLLQKQRVYHWVDRDVLVVENNAPGSLWDLGNE